MALTLDLHMSTMGKFMNLLVLVYTFGNPIHDIEKTTWILVVVVEIQ